MLDIKKVREACFGLADQIGRKKNGNITLRRGFFYTNGMSSSKLAASAIKRLQDIGITATLVDHADVWKPFRGGSALRNQSHFYVELS